MTIYYELFDGSTFVDAEGGDVYELFDGSTIMEQEAVAPAGTTHHIHLPILGVGSYLAFGISVLFLMV